MLKKSTSDQGRQRGLLCQSPESKVSCAAVPPSGIESREAFHLELRKTCCRFHKGSPAAAGPIAHQNPVRSNALGYGVASAFNLTLLTATPPHPMGSSHLSRSPNPPHARKFLWFSHPHGLTIPAKFVYPCHFSTNASQRHDVAHA